MRARQGDRELDQPEGGRSGLRRSGASGASIRGGSRRHGVRRSRPGRHRRPEVGNLRAVLPYPDRTGRASRRKTSYSIPTSSRSAPASKSTTITASPSSRRPSGSRIRFPARRSPAASPTFPFRSAATIRYARRSIRSFSITPSGRSWIWASSMPGQLAVYDDIEPDLRERVEDLVLNRRPDATERLLEVAGSVQGRRKEASRRRPGVARRHGRCAPGACAGQWHRRYVVEDTEEARLARDGPSRSSKGR